MAAIHFIDGEKGGVGKSLFARVTVQYCIDKKLSYELIDADPTNPDVGAFYPENHKKAVFSESERKEYEADEIFNLALNKPVIVNLPAQVYLAVKNWYERNDILDIAGKNNIKIYKWFVCSGGYDSVQLFIQSLEEFGSKIQHVLVRNLGLCDDWKHINNRNDLCTLLNTHKVAVIDLPKFSYRERDIIDANHFTFSEARDYKELGVLGKQRLHNFLKTAHEEIEKAQIWNLSKIVITTPSEGATPSETAGTNKSETTGNTNDNGKIILQK
jgi:hypothetical protein